MDAAGNLYGTTSYGGSGKCTFQGINGCGTVFALSRKAGVWTERILHTFNGKDGDQPYGSLIFDAAGSLYGTTYYGGAYYGSTQITDGGTVFELTPKGTGRWREKVLHSFGANPAEGNFPKGGLARDGAGNLYGTTNSGGAEMFAGTVFELTPQSGGQWAEKIVHSFAYNFTDGWYPEGSLVFDASGNLYGTASSGGANGGGAVFKLSRNAGDRWTETVYSLGQGTDGQYPNPGLVPGAAGNFYGTTQHGGDSGFGVVFEITP